MQRGANPVREEPRLPPVSLVTTSPSGWRVVGHRRVTAYGGTVDGRSDESEDQARSAAAAKATLVERAPRSLGSGGG